MPLVAVVALLQLFGLLALLSASSVIGLRVYGTGYYFFVRQLVALGLGWVLFLVAARCDYRRLRRAATPSALAVIFLLVVVLVPHIGVTANGSTRWLGAGAVRVQPSEFAKLVIVIFAAHWVSREQARPGLPRTYRPVLLLLCVAVTLVMAQPDMGTTIILAAIVLSVLFCAGAPGRSIWRWMLTALAGLVLAGILAPYRRDRLLSFLHPSRTASTTGYQSVQGLVALGSGGVFGVGLGASRAKWGFLPNAHTDFIFAVIGEETGLIGSLLIVALFCAILVVGVGIAGNAPDRFGCLLAVGLTSWLVVQGVINIGAVIGVLPVTGVPLPFVSFGGTSVVVLMAGLGLLASVARSSHADPVPDANSNLSGSP